MPSSASSSGNIPATSPAVTFDLIQSGNTSAYVPPSSGDNDSGVRSWTLDFRVRNGGTGSIKNVVVTFSSKKTPGGLAVPSGSGWSVTRSGDNVVATYAGVIAPGGILPAANVTFTTQGNTTIALVSKTAASAY